MKKFLFIVLALASLVSEAQTPAKLYTKKVRMADFPSAVTRIVLGGDSMMDMVVRQEVASCWNASPYEFCTPDEYEAMKTDNSFYFLRFAHSDGLVFMILSKGGKEDETDQLKIPFEVVRLPVGAYGSPSGLEADLVGAFLEVLQQFALKSMTSDRVGYRGMEAYNGANMSGKTIVIDHDRVSEALSSRTSGILVGVSVAPLEIGLKTVCYKMLIDACTHEVYYYSKAKYREKSDAWFSDKELSRFEKRNAIIER